MGEREARFDPDFDSYESFYDHPWAEEILEKVEKSLWEEAVFSLLVNWKEAANVSRSPWLTATLMAAISNGVTAGGLPLDRIIEGLHEGLVRRMGSLLSDMARRKLKREITSIAQETPPIQCSAKEVWDDGLISDSEFILGILGSQRLCYVSVYFTYEDFIQTCVGVKKRDPSYKARNARKLCEGVLEEFGQSAVDDYLRCAVVKTAKEKRNAIAHNGGRVRTPANDDWLVGEVQIKVEDTKLLYKDLKSLVSTFVEKDLLGVLPA